MRSDPTQHNKPTRAQQTGVRVIGFVVVSNYYHLIVFGPHGRISDLLIISIAASAWSHCVAMTVEYS